MNIQAVVEAGWMALLSLKRPLASSPQQALYQDIEAFRFTRAPSSMPFAAKTSSFLPVFSPTVLLGLLGRVSRGTLSHRAGTDAAVRFGF